MGSEFNAHGVAMEIAVALWIGLKAMADDDGDLAFQVSRAGASVALEHENASGRPRINC